MNEHRPHPDHPEDFLDFEKAFFAAGEAHPEVHETEQSGEPPFSRQGGSAPGGTARIWAWFQALCTRLGWFRTVLAARLLFPARTALSAGLRRTAATGGSLASLAASLLRVARLDRLAAVGRRRWRSVSRRQLARLAWGLGRLRQGVLELLQPLRGREAADPQAHRAAADEPPSRFAFRRPALATAALVVLISTVGTLWAAVVLAAVHKL